MRVMRTILPGLAMLSGIAAAQPPATPAPASAGEVVVQGRRGQPSNWREAETDHVIVIGDGGERDLTRIAHDLERLYFLLSVLLNRSDRPDETIKLRVTLIGDAAEFQAMDLRNLRWQQGPFNAAFDVGRYYDPREDGAVMATTRIDQRAVLERGTPLSQALLGLQMPGSGGQPGNAPLAGGALFGLQSQPFLIPPVNEQSVPMSADSLIRAGFAQHFLTTFFPAAYPRWYLDGFGQMFSTMATRGDGVLEYGRAPEGSSIVLKTFGSYSLSDVLDGHYLTQKPGRTRWTPVHAWMLTHFLFFSPTRSGQFRQYLKAIAGGTPAAEAAGLFGDPDGLARELGAYYRAKKPYERMTYPVDRAAAPVVRRLTQGEAAFVKGRLELESRVDAVAAATEPKERAATIAARDRWLARLRSDAARFPYDAGAQLLLAEAEARCGHATEALAATDRVLALAPDSSPALAWRGAAMTQAAVAGPVAARPAALHAARATIARANRADTDAVQPLIAYYRSYALAGETVPVVAIDGLTKAMIRVPNAPATRLMLGGALAARGQDAVARTILRPVAIGGYDTPEKGAAEGVMAGMTGR